VIAVGACAVVDIASMPSRKKRRRIEEKERDRAGLVERTGL
jgi:hypothetical protein